MDSYLSLDYDMPEERYVIYLKYRNKIITRIYRVCLASAQTPARVGTNLPSTNNHPPTNIEHLHCQEVNQYDKPKYNNQNTALKYRSSMNLIAATRAKVGLVLYVIITVIGLKINLVLFLWWWSLPLYLAQNLKILV